MMTRRFQAVSRIALILFVLLSGIALLPITGISAEKLGWEAYAEAYQPDLDVVGQDKGAPGSAFLFRGVGYPRNTLATVYVDGVARGTLMTNNRGRAVFVIRSEAGDPTGRYFVTLAINSNVSATDDVRLRTDKPLIPPPPGWNGPTFFLFGDK